TVALVQVDQPFTDLLADLGAKHRRWVTRGRRSITRRKRGRTPRRRVGVSTGTPDAPKVRELPALQHDLSGDGHHPNVPARGRARRRLRAPRSSPAAHAPVIRTGRAP